VTIGPSERVDIEIFAHNPGVWMFHCHMQHHGANGMMTTIRYEGVAPPMGEHQHAAVPLVPVAPAVPSGSGTPAAAPAPAQVAGSTTVVMADNRFQPATLHVAVGTTVSWPNNGANIHTISAMDGSFESGSIVAGGSFSYTFSAVGQYLYVCRQHLLNGMRGTITVH
jgi:plastocyanin